MAPTVPAALPCHPVAAAPVAAVQVPAEPAAVAASAGSAVGPIAAGLLLAAMAAAALVLARRRRRVPRLVEVLEAASLGPRRSLVVVRMGDDVMLLGASEGGVSLLATRPAAGLVAEAARDTLPGPAPAAAPDPAARGRHPAAPRSRFDALLAESDEDAELRRKLAAGLAGSVR